MTSRSFAVVASLLALCATAACENKPSPLAPSSLQSAGGSDPISTSAPQPPLPVPAPAPAPQPAPAPTPAPASSAPMAFTPDAATPGVRSYSLQPAEMNGNDIYVGLHAKDFGADAVNMVRATISFDPAVVSLVSFSSADSWMDGFGHKSTFSVSKSGTNLIKVRVDMPSSSAGASGSGRILRLRFRKVAAGTSRLEFVEGQAYDAGYNNSLRSQHGGMLIVQ